jgi:YD repeat-containing protein
MKFKLMPLIFAFTILCQKADAFYRLSISQNISSYLPQEILPPGPTAFSLGQYGNVAPSLVTGAISQSIPIYTFKCGELEIPISMGYTSTGIKVDQTASWVGLGWNLLAGGVINRVIRDEPDEKKALYKPIGLVHYSEEFGNFLLNHEQYNLQPDIFSFSFNGYSGTFCYDGQKFIIAPYQNLQITAGPGFSSFIIKMPDGVEYTFDVCETSRNPSSSKSTMSEFNNTAWYCSKITHPRGDVIYLEYNDPLSFSYWTGINQTFVMAFDAPPGVMDVDEGYQSITVNSRSLKKIWNPQYGSVNFSTSQNRMDLNDVKLDSISIYTANNKFIKKYSFNYTNVTCNGPVAKFGPSNLKYRLFLDAINEESGTLPSNRLTHQFEYNNRSGMPSRLSFSQDYWGYFNNSAGTDFVPDDYSSIFTGRGNNRNADPTYGVYGLLQKITYPTKGWTTIEYEPQSYWGSRTITPPPVEESIVTLGTGNVKTNLESLEIPFAQTIEINFNVTFTGGTPGPADKAIVEITNDASGPVTYELLASNCNMVILFPCIQNLYSFRITSYGTNTNAGITITYHNQQPYNEFSNLSVGGMRVARIRNYDGINPNPVLKRYYYNKYTDRTKSCGIKGLDPVYYSQVNRKGPRNGFPCEDNVSHVCSSNSLNTMYTISGDYINYRYVTESYGENFESGGKEYEFDIYSDQSGGLLFGFNFIIGTPLNNDSWQNGKLLSEKSFKVVSNTPIVISETKNFYNVFKGPEVSGYAVALDAEGECTFGYAFVTNCSPNIEESIIEFGCTDNHCGGWVAGPRNKDFKVCVKTDCINEFTFYPIRGFKSKENCLANHSHTWKTVNSSQFAWQCKIGIQHYGINAVDQCYYFPGQQISRNEVFERYSVMEYKFYSSTSLLDSVVSVLYDNNGNNPVTSIVKYYYENPLHMQPTQIRTWLSDGRIMNVYPRLSSDFYFDETEGIPTNESSRGIFYLLADNILNSPVEYTETVNDNPIKGQIITYKLGSSFVNPDKYYEWFGTPASGYTPLALDASTFSMDPKYSERIKYQFNENAKLIQADKKDNYPVSYIWGYNDTYPVVKLEGLTYNNISSSIKTNINSRNFSSSSKYADVKIDADYLKGQLTTLMTDSRYMITLYTYSPLIGITSQTDPNGITTYYEYDKLGRLYIVRDENGSILKTYEYHYNQ